MRKLWSVVVLGAVGAGLACDGGTGPTGDLLSEEETEVIASAVIGVAMQSGINGNTGTPAAAAYSTEPVSFDVSIDRTVECEAGGTMRLDGSMGGTVDSQTGEGTLDLEFTQTANDCGVETEHHGTFVINGDPNLVLSGDLSWGASGPDGTSTFTYRGGFAWSQGERSGTCGVDVELTWSATSASYSGSVCGDTFEVNVSTG